MPTLVWNPSAEPVEGYLERVKVLSNNAINSNISKLERLESTYMGIAKNAAAYIVDGSQTPANISILGNAALVQAYRMNPGYFSQGPAYLDHRSEDQARPGLYAWMEHDKKLSRQGKCALRNSVRCEMDDECAVNAATRQCVPKEHKDDGCAAAAYEVRQGMLGALDALTQRHASARVAHRDSRAASAARSQAQKNHITARRIAATMGNNPDVQSLVLQNMYGARDDTTCPADAVQACTALLKDVYNITLQKPDQQKLTAMLSSKCSTRRR